MEGKTKSRSDQMKKLSILLLLTVLISCGDDSDKEVQEFSCGQEVSLSEHVMPIIDASCAISLCHENGVQPLLNTAEEIIAKSDRIAARVEAGTMPPSSLPPLTSEEEELILCWVEDGAPDN